MYSKSNIASKLNLTQLKHLVYKLVWKVKFPGYVSIPEHTLQEHHLDLSKSHVLAPVSSTDNTKQLPCVFF